MNVEDELAVRVTSFAEELTRTFQSVLGHQEITLKADLLEDKFTITTPQNGLIELNAAGEPLLDLKVRYECGWDFPRRYMAVDVAEFHVFAHGTRNLCSATSSSRRPRTPFQPPTSRFTHIATPSRGP